MPKSGANKVLDFLARCHMNEVNNMGEGGRILIHAVDSQVRAEETGLRQVETIINAATDKAMEPFPSTKGDLAKRKLRIVVYDEGEFTAEEMVELGLTNND